MEGPNAAETAIAIVAVAGGLLAFTIVATIWVWQYMASSRARAFAASEDAYRTLAEEMSESQRRSAVYLEELREDVAALRPRIEEIERMIREVG